MAHRNWAKNLKKQHTTRPESNWFHIQKKTFNYTEASAEKRAQYQQEIQDIAPENIIYSDESGIDDNEVIMTGWAPEGERCYASKNAERKRRYNIVAALSVNTLFAPFVFEGHSNTAIYETYIERVLIPVLKPGMVLVIDNASFHKSTTVKQLVEAAGCRVIFLPPYSPDFNPIEHYWASVKSAIKKAAQHVDDFFEAIVNVLGGMCAA